MDRRKLSELRLRLNALLKERAACEEVAQGRSEMVRAALLEREMAPWGNTGFYLSATIEGRARHRYVRKAEIEVWRRRCARWREFHQAMAKWRKVSQEIEQLMRTMGRERCVPFPPKKKHPHERRVTRASRRKQ